MLPGPVTVGLEEAVGQLWFKRVAQHTDDSYAGIGMSKFPEDLRVYEHLLWETHATAVIELGSYLGGSAVWFRDRLGAFAHYGRGSRPLVISIDTNVAAARANIAGLDPGYEDTILLMEADVTDPSLPDRVGKLLPPDARCLVIEDSAHVYDTTAGALRGFARFVPPSGFFVVEDGCVDIDAMRLTEDWPRGVLPAVRDWLDTPEGGEFVMRRDMEMYGISCHPEGYLQRR